MVRADLGSSGVMFSLDTETGFRDVVLINAAYGLSETVVQGSVNPDEYVVFKPTLLEGLRPILQKTLGSKEFKLVYDVGGSKMTRGIFWAVYCYHARNVSLSAGSRLGPPEILALLGAGGMG